LIRRSLATDPLARVLVQDADEDDSAILVHPSDRKVEAAAEITWESAREVLKETPPVTVLHPEPGFE
jgi:hypothetical protein